MADPNPLARSPIRGPCRTIAAPCLLLALAMVLDAPGPARALQPCTPTTALQPAAGAQFGCSCATDGTAAAVGAMRDPAAAPAAGALYVLQPGGEVRLTAGDAGAGDQLGFSVAVGGGTLAGGAPFAAAPGAAHAGAVYVFSARDGSWSAASSQVKLVAPDARSGDHFGQTLALKGDRIAVGAPDRTGSGGSFSGAVYLFQRSGGGAWTLEAELADPDAAPFDGFGYSVALDGDVLAVGAPFADRPGGGGSLGAVHVFARGASGWNRVARLTAKDGADGDELGVVVALDGGTLVAGARRADVAGRVDAGAAYVFSLNGGAWIQTAELTAPAPGAGDLFGSAVAVAGPRVVVGARFHGEGAPNAGAVYVFDPIGKPPTVVLGNPPQAGAELGAAVAASGDAVIASASLADVGGAVDAGSVLACPSPLGTATFKISKTHGREAYRPGQLVTYTITVTNIGTGSGTAQVTDLIPPQLVQPAWCRGPGCTPDHAGNLDDTVILAAQESTVYTVTGLVLQGTRDPIVNTACVGPQGAAPLCATDIDPRGGGTPQPGVSLVLTQNDGSRETVCPGSALTYTITVLNLGSAFASGVLVTDTFPPALHGVTWTCAGSPGNCGARTGAGTIADLASLPPGGAVTYTATGTVSPDATGTLTNQACANGSTCSAVDTDRVACTGDLKATKTDGVDTVSRGQALTYTITVKNLGPDTITGASVTDPVPAGLTAVAWSCAASPGSFCGPAGAGPIADHVTLPSGGTATYTMTAVVGPNAAGTISNRVCAATPPGTTDPTPSNDCVTDVDTVVAPVVDIKITKSGPANALPGQAVVYPITVTNTGTAPISGALVTDAFPPALEQVRWCCGAGCAPVNAGAFHDVALSSLGPGGAAVCQVTGIVAPAFTGILVNTATAALPSPLVDPTPEDNVATVETMVMPGPGVTGFCDGIDGPFVEGGTISYTFVLRNGGPFTQADNPGDEFTDVLPPQLTLLSASASSGTATTLGNTASWNGAIPVKGAVTITVTAMINAGTAGMTICNQGAFAFDADGDGANESHGLTDDPALPGAADPCCFRVLIPPEIPALAPSALALLALLLVAAALWRLRRRRVA